MKRLYRYPLTIIFILAWLVVMIFPLFSLILVIRGEIMVGSEQDSHLRIFMVNAEDQNGVAVEWSRRINDNEDCLRTDVNFLLWEGSDSGLDVAYCSCFDSLGHLVEQTSTCTELNEADETVPE